MKGKKNRDYVKNCSRLVKNMLEVRAAFMEKPSALGSGLGRTGMHKILDLSYELIWDVDELIQQRIGVRNLGGGAPYYNGSVTLVGYNGDRYQSTEEAMEFLASCKVPRPTRRWKRRHVSVKVPDGQLYYPNDIERFDVTGEVKSFDESDNNKADLQAWKQALIGLLKADMAYGVLLRPGSAKIVQLTVHPPQQGQSYRYLTTADRVWELVQEGDGCKFDVKAFIEFLEGIIDVMYRKSFEILQDNKQID